MLTTNWRDELDDQDRADYEAWLDSLADNSEAEDDRRGAAFLHRMLDDDDESEAA